MILWKKDQSWFRLQKLCYLPPWSGSSQQYKVLNSSWTWDYKQSESFHISQQFFKITHEVLYHESMWSTVTWGSYTKLHITKLYRITHTHTHTSACKTGKIWTNFLVLIHTKLYIRCYHRGSWVKDAWGLPCKFFQSLLIYNYFTIKS